MAAEDWLLFDIWDEEDYDLRMGQPYWEYALEIKLQNELEREGRTIHKMVKKWKSLKQSSKTTHFKKLRSSGSSTSS